jgi:hypothetical protein
MPDSDEIQLRLQAYQLAIQQGTTPDTVYSWLTQEGVPGQRPELAAVHELHPRQQEIREQFHPARAAAQADSGPPPERNYLVSDAAEDVARSFLQAVRVTWTDQGGLTLRFRDGIQSPDLAMLLAASDQADAFYGPN